MIISIYKVDKMPLLRKINPQSQVVWGNPKKESVPIFTNETPMIVEIEQKKSKEPIQMLAKLGTEEKKYKPGERLIKESKKLQGGKKEKKRNYKNSISELLEELFVN